MKNIFTSSIMVKIDRIAAWVLLVTVVLYAVTGFGMTKGIIDRSLASTWHLGWLGLVGLSAFVIHTAWAVHLSFRRWRIWNFYTKILLGLFYGILILGGFYLQFFYSPKTIVETVNIVGVQVVETATDSQLPIFTAKTLKEYNGLNGQSAYVAVDGLVYDLSQVFQNGKHYGYSAGQELSVPFYSHHIKSALEKFTIVGQFEK